jgi:GTP-binding protein HflX
MLDPDLHLSSDSVAALVSIVSPNFESHSNTIETERSLDELGELMRTLEIETVGRYVQNKKSIEPATILGKGKLIEIAEEAESNGADILVFDFELTASQIRNIKKVTKLAVIDRCHVILEIFSKHARTRDARIQIEISRLQYLLPRLMGFWSHFSRQKGGIGMRGGEGEQQIELDRRIIRQRIEHHKKELVEIEKSREQQRKKRQNKAVTAALVGYTNAGKSSLMNALCRVDVKSENKLFATLDATFRMLNPDTKPPMILIDTVGFISNLPNTLIEGFKTTLESALEADLLLIVCDISDPNMEKHIEVTQSVLDELGLKDKDRIFVFNKTDLVQDKFKLRLIKRNYPDSFLVSSFEKSDVNELRSHVINYFLDKQNHFDLFIPYADGEAHSEVMGQTNIINQENYDHGIFYRVKTPDFIFYRLSLKKYVLGPDKAEEYLQGLSEDV